MLSCGRAGFLLLCSDSQYNHDGRALAASRTLQHCLEGNSEPAANSLFVFSSSELRAECSCHLNT